jgi:hypothetical protein
LHSVAPMTVTIRRAPRRRLSRLVVEPVVLEIRGDDMSAAQEALYLLRQPTTLRNWRSSGKGPEYITVAGRPRYGLTSTEAWITEHVTGPGGRHRYFPVGRVSPEEVARYLIASDSPRFKGKNVGEVVDLLEYMRGDGYGPPWLNLAGVVSYWILEVVRWAKEGGIQSKYAMLAMVGKVVIKPPRSESALTQEEAFSLIDDSSRGHGG